MNWTTGTSPEPRRKAGCGGADSQSRAEQRGLEYSQHRHLFSVVEILARETNDTELSRLFHVANGLHSNFYENWLSPESVKEDIGRFLDKVARVL
jgi:hypothetical protein